jgi:hypothetical protein
MLRANQTKITSSSNEPYWNASLFFLPSFFFDLLVIQGIRRGEERFFLFHILLHLEILCRRRRSAFKKTILLSLTLEVSGCDEKVEKYEKSFYDDIRLR